MKILAEFCYADGKHLGESYHILGDTAYPLSNHLITPYRLQGGRLGAEKKFNMHLSSKRSVIECAFGLLGLRFPRLLKLKCKHQGKRVMTVVACCVLHNWCLMEDDGRYFFLWGNWWIGNWGSSGCPCNFHSWPTFHIRRCDPQAWSIDAYHIKFPINMYLNLFPFKLNHFLLYFQSFFFQSQKMIQFVI